ncbi:restriction endonuclease subunit S (plasmid) [Clostridium perfringens]
MFNKKTIRGVPKSEENLDEKVNGYHIFGQNIKYQYPQKVLLDEKYLTKVDENKPILAYTSSTCQIGMIKESFYRTGNNGAFQGLFPKFTNYTYKSLLYILTQLMRYFDEFGYDTGMANVLDLKFSLPTKNGEIDFEFMESFVAELEAQRVAELEAQRVAELEAYLLATGLKDYKLTDKEKQAIDEIDKIQWKEFHLIDVFNVKNTKNILSTQVKFNSGNTPYLCASTENNGVASYITFNDLYIDKGNCIFIGGKTFAVSYQKEDFYSNDSHNLALYLICKDMLTEKNQLYMATCIKKGLGHKYSWGNSISNKKIQTDTIMLPVHDNHVDYVYMETLISAIQKLVIRDVVLFADRKIDATKQVIDS